MKDSNPTNDGIKEAQKIAKSYFEFMKIKAIKKTVQVSTRTTLGVFYLILIMMSLFFLGVALALFASILLDSYALGFLITGALPLVILLLLRLFKVPINRYLLNFFTRILIED